MSAAAHLDEALMSIAESEARDAFETMLAREAQVTRAKEMVLAANKRWLAAQETLLRIREQARG